jgi:hypothetical protein
MKVSAKSADPDLVDDVYRDEMSGEMGCAHLLAEKGG